MTQTSRDQSETSCRKLETSQIHTTDTHHRYTLQMHNTDTHYKYTLHTLVSHHRYTLQMHTRDTHNRCTPQMHTTDTIRRTFTLFWWPVRLFSCLSVQLSLCSPVCYDPLEEILQMTGTNSQIMILVLLHHVSWIKKWWTWIHHTKIVNGMNMWDLNNGDGLDTVGFMCTFGYCSAKVAVLPRGICKIWKGAPTKHTYQIL